MLDPDKERLTYAEWTDVLEELAELGAEIARKEGRTEPLSKAEVLRRLTLREVNRRRKSKGKKPLDLPPESNIADRKAA
jgi:hypothetical protein